MVNITNFNDVKYFFESNDIDIVINLSDIILTHLYIN
jgi:hypothetical protein